MRRESSAPCSTQRNEPPTAILVPPASFASRDTTRAPPTSDIQHDFIVAQIYTSTQASPLPPPHPLSKEETYLQTPPRLHSLRTSWTHDPPRARTRAPRAHPQRRITPHRSAHPTAGVDRAHRDLLVRVVGRVRARWGRVDVLRGGLGGGGGAEVGVVCYPQERGGGVSKRGKGGGKGQGEGEGKNAQYAPPGFAAFPYTLTCSYDPCPCPWS